MTQAFSSDFEVGGHSFNPIHTFCWKYAITEAVLKSFPQDSLCVTADFLLPAGCNGLQSSNTSACTPHGPCHDDNGLNI